MAGGNDIEHRIRKDIDKFYAGIGTVKTVGADRNVVKLVELAQMYASDSKSYLDKKDFYTAFSCISYAHGLLDAVKGILGE